MSDFTAFELGNGIRLHARRDDRFTSTSLAVFVQRPLDAQAADTAILPALLKSGTRRLPSIPLLARECQELWGTSFDVQITRAADRLVLVFRLEVPDGSFLPGDDPLPGALRLLVEVMTDPRLEGEHFAEADVERERVNLANWIKGRRDDKAGWASERCAAETFRGEAYACHEWGELDDVARCTRERVTGRHRDLLRSAPVDVLVVGRFDPAEARDRLAGELRWERNGAATLAAPAAALPREDGVREIIEREEIEQGKLVMGFRSPIRRGDAAMPAAVVFGTVLGGTSVSRLFKTVREEHGLAYYCHAGFDPSTGAMFVTSGIDPAHYARVVPMVREQIQRLTTEGPTADEVRQAQQRLTARIRTAADAPPALISQNFAEMVSGHVRTTDDRIASIEAVTPADVQQAGAAVALDTVFFLAPEGADTGSAL